MGRILRGQRKGASLIVGALVIAFGWPCGGDAGLARPHPPADVPPSKTDIASERARTKWTLIKYRVFPSRLPVLVQRPQHSCIAVGNMRKRQVTSHIMLECDGCDSAQRHMFSADDTLCEGRSMTDLIELPFLDGGGWNITCVESQQILAFRPANKSLPDPFYAQSPINTAGCDVRELTRPKVPGVTVLTFVDRPGHLGHSNFLHSMKVLGYGPHLNIDVDLKTKCAAAGLTDDHLLECIYRARLSTYLPYLRALPSDEVVLVTDTFDAMLVTPASQLQQTFRTAYRCENGEYCRVVIASEMLCDTESCRNDPKLKQGILNMVPKSSHGTRYQFLNAGSLIGYAGALLAHFECTVAVMTKPNFRGDDQLAMTMCYLQGKRHEITIDYDTKLIGVVPPDRRLFDLEWIMEENHLGVSPLRRRGSPSDQLGPSVIHFAGIRYLDQDGQTFNQCQLHLAKIYNTVGKRLRSPALTQWHANRVRPRVVVSLTTLPSRINGVVETVLSLLKQSVRPDAIYLNVPAQSERFKGASYIIPPSLDKIKELTILHTTDFGPATKLIATLDREKGDTTLIITVDDDMVYAPSTVATLLEAHLLNPNAAYGFAGQMIDLDPCNATEQATETWPGVCAARPHVRSADAWQDRHAAVDILEAFKGAIYRRDFFDLVRLRKIPAECRRTDDIWISANLAAVGIPRVKLLTDAHPTASSNDVVNPLRLDNVQGIGQNVRCAMLVLDQFLAMRNPEPAACPVRFQELNATLVSKRAYYDSGAYFNNHHSPCSGKLSRWVLHLLVISAVAVIMATRWSPRFRAAVWARGRMFGWLVVFDRYTTVCRKESRC